MAVAWAISATNSLKNVTRHSPNPLAFEKNSNFPIVCDDQLPLLENKTSSQVVAENVNALHHVRQNFINTESSSKLKPALRHQICTFSNIMYNTGDIVFYKWKKS